MRTNYTSKTLSVVHPPGGIGRCPPVIGQNPAEAGHFSSFDDDPIGFITEALIASEDAWSELPGLAPLLLREALAELLEVAE